MISTSSKRFASKWFAFCILWLTSIGMLAPLAAEGQESAAAEAPQTSAAPVALAELDDLLDRAIHYSSLRYLRAEAHTPWQIMHGILAYKQAFVIKEGDRKVSALEWMARGATYKGEPWFEVTQFGGRAHPYSRPYIFEGHPNQFLAKMARAHVPADFRLKADRGMITISDIVENAKMEVNAADEPTWTLWALSHYLGPDAEWVNKSGEPWSIERLVRMQIGAPLHGAACGGTHAMFALSFARAEYEKTGRPLRGVWIEVDQTIRRQIEAARALQNSDGTFSTSYFAGRGQSPDFATRCATSGHMLEFLAMGMPEHRLREDWLERAVRAVAADLVAHRREPVDCGPLYHAVSGLAIYRERTRPAAE